jgi:CRP-like cAMP-binding protein
MADFFDRIVILKSTSTFSEVSTDDLRVVAEEMQEQAYFPGEHVFEINDPSDRMYILLTGKIGISIHRDPKVRDFWTELGPGECFGEMGSIDGSPRSGTAHVLEDSLLLYLDKLKLHGLIASYPELALGLLRGLSVRLRQTSEKLISALDSAPARKH